MADLNAEQREFYAAVEHMHNTSGWALLTQGWRQEQTQLEEYLKFGANTLEDLHAARQRWAILGELIDLPETWSAQKQSILDGDDDQ